MPGGRGGRLAGLASGGGSAVGGGKLEGNGGSLSLPDGEYAGVKPEGSTIIEPELATELVSGMYGRLGGGAAFFTGTQDEDVFFWTYSLPPEADGHLYSWAA